MVQQVESSCNAGATGATGLIPGPERSLGEGNPLPRKSHGQSSLWATVQGVAKQADMTEYHTQARYSGLGVSVDLKAAWNYGRF